MAKFSEEVDWSNTHSGKLHLNQRRYYATLPSSYPEEGDDLRPDDLDGLESPRSEEIRPASAPCAGDLEEDDKSRQFMAIKPWLGAMYPPSKYLKDPKNPNECMTVEENNWQAPVTRLELDYVFGYRARDCHQNLHWVDEKHIVFPAAAVGVILDLDTTDEDFFFGHDDDIVCLDYHPGLKLCASGSIGARNTVRLCVWETKVKNPDDSLKEKWCWTGFHQFAVTSVAFSPNGKYIASLGLDEHHSVAIYSIETGLLLATSAADKNRVVHLGWNTCKGIDSNACFMTVGVKHVAFWTPKEVLASNKSYYEVTDDPLDQRLIWSRGFGCKDIDNIYFSCQCFTSLYALCGDSMGFVNAFNPSQYELLFRIEVSKSRILSIIPIPPDQAKLEEEKGKPEEKKAEEKPKDPDHIAVGGQEGFVWYYNVVADPLSKDDPPYKQTDQYNLNVLDSATDNESDFQVNAVRAMSFFPWTGQLLVGTILSQIYSINARVPSKANYRGRILAMFEKYAPEEAKKIVAIMERFKAKDCKESEEEYIAGLVKKYGPEPGATNKSETLLSGHWGSFKEKEGYGELWGVAAHPSKQFAVTCCEDATIRLWDLVNNTLLQRRNMLLPALRCDISNDGKMIAVGYKNGSFSIFDGELKEQLCPIHRNRKRRVRSIRFSPNSKLLAVAAESSIDLYKIIWRGEKGFDASVAVPEQSMSNFASSSPEKSVKKTAQINVVRYAVCRGHTSLLNAIDWNVSSSIIQSASQGYELLFFTAKGERITGTRALADQDWFTQSCILGWSVQGIWPRFADGTDINSVSRSHCQTVLALTDDWGRVKLFNFPCVGSGLDRLGKLRIRPSFNEYVGHCSHVTNCCWSFDDTYLMTTGGADLCMFLWKVVHPTGDRPPLLNAAEIAKREKEYAATRTGPANEAALHCEMCDHEYKDPKAEVCPRCAAPRKLSLKEHEFTTSTRARRSLLVKARYKLPTKTFAESTKSQQALRRQIEGAEKLKKWMPSGASKVPTLPEVDTDSDEELIRQKVLMNSKSSSQFPSAAPTPKKAAAPSAKKRTAGPQFFDF